MRIIYKDGDIIAVNKPAGIAVHPDHHHKKGTVIQEISQKFPGHPVIAHRLDKDTSGVLVVARNQKAFIYLKNQFKARKVLKKYLALVVGQVKKKKGAINLNIGRSNKDSIRRVSRGHQRGTIRDAITEYRVQRIFPLSGAAPHGFSLVEVHPITGRTHQIRSHFAAIDHPVVCDKLYAGKRYICPFGLDRHFLHASLLEFTLPTGGRIRLEAELPEDLNKVLKGLRLMKNDGILYKSQ